MSSCSANSSKSQNLLGDYGNVFDDGSIDGSIDDSIDDSPGLNKKYIVAFSEKFESIGDVYVVSIFGNRFNVKKSSIITTRVIKKEGQIVDLFFEVNNPEASGSEIRRAYSRNTYPVNIKSDTEASFMIAFESVSGGIAVNSTDIRIVDGELSFGSVVIARDVRLPIFWRENFLSSVKGKQTKLITTNTISGQEIVLDRGYFDQEGNYFPTLYNKLKLESMSDGNNAVYTEETYVSGHTIYFRMYRDSSNNLKLDRITKQGSTTIEVSEGLIIR
ncbi:MAG: hypothetical protein ACRCTQ_05685 [Brevinemataceae bacterium]